MTRALSLTCLLLVGLVGQASAGKPQIAVLGLEVVDPNGNPAAADAQMAKDLTEGLRARAKLGNGSFQYAPNSEKELTDVKLLNSCDDEKPACMAAIGNQLGADELIYGKVEKQGGAYLVTLKLLDVRRKAPDKATTKQIPISDASGAKLQGSAKALYSALTGGAPGTIVLKVNVDHGTVFVDDQPKGSVNNGVAKIEVEKEGSHKVRIETDGYHRWDKDITVTAGESTTTTVELEKSEVAPPPACDPATDPKCPGSEIGHTGTVSSGTRGNSTWKGVAVASALVSVAGVALVFYGRSQISSATSAECAAGGYYKVDNSATPVWSSTNLPACPLPGNPPGNMTTTTPTINKPDADAANSKGNTGQNETYVGTAVAIGFGAFAAVAIYEGFIAKHAETPAEHVSNGHRVRRQPFVVMPVLAPNGGGATVLFQW